MGKNVTINLDLGDGLHTTPSPENKLAVYYEPNGNMYLETSDDAGENGIFVKNLNGADGANSGSRYDGWSTVSGTGWNMNNNKVTTNNFIDMNREVVNLIFTFGLYKPSMRHPTYIDYSSEVKDVKSICNEIVAPINYSATSYTSYKPAAGELIQLVTNPTFRHINYSGGTTIATESLNRVIGANQEVKVMFVITKIQYLSDIQQGGSQYWVHNMSLCCIYSTVPDFVVGTTYTGTQGFDTNHV